MSYHYEWVRTPLSSDEIKIMFDEMRTLSMPNFDIYTNPHIKFQRKDTGEEASIGLYTNAGLFFGISCRKEIREKYNLDRVEDEDIDRNVQMLREESSALLVGMEECLKAKMSLSIIPLNLLVQVDK